MPPQPSHPTAGPRHWLSTCTGLVLVALATAGFAAYSGFRPPPGFVGDFTQDWLSAREFRAGHPVYGSLPDARRRHVGEEPPEDFLRWNAHPPGSILLVLPLASFDHDRAFFLWNLLTFPLFVGAVWVVAVELGVRPGWRAAAVAASVSVIGGTCHPLYQQVSNGQFNALLAFLITVAWAADRRSRWVIAGAAIGAATAVKLFPGFLLLYLLTARQWRAAGVAVVAFLSINAVGICLFGLGAYQTYICEVIPAVLAEYATRWNNLSAPAFWLRLFNPTPSSRGIPVAHWPVVGKALAVTAQLMVVALVGWVGWRARTPAARDRAFAAGVVGMLLVSPITWPHYLVILVVPVGLLIVGFPSGTARVMLMGCLLVLWLPDNFVPWLVYGRDEAKRMSVHRHHHLTPTENVLIGSVPHYALLGVFLLTLRLPAPGPEPQKRERVAAPDA